MRIIQKQKTKYWKQTHKYGIEIPKTYGQAVKINRRNNNTLWQDAVDSEMKEIIISMDKHKGAIEELIGYVRDTGHLIFDVKLDENFRRKARYVANGHKTTAPPEIMYSTVVARDSVRIILLIAALNDLQLKAANIQNAFLTAPNKEKHYIIAGPEFGVHQGKCYIVTKALYGLKSTGASFCLYLAQRLDNMNFKSSFADPDVWIRPANKASREEYYEYILCYVDDILAVSINADEIMEDIKGRFKLKNDEVKEPDYYLGAKLQKKHINGTWCWTISSIDYLLAAIKTVQNSLKSKHRKLPTKVRTPMTTSCMPELDGTSELNKEDLS